MTRSKNTLEPFVRLAAGAAVDRCKSKFKESNLFCFHPSRKVKRFNGVCIASIFFIMSTLLSCAPMANYKLTL